MLRIIFYIKKMFKKFLTKIIFAFFYIFLNDRSFGINFDKYYFFKNFWLKKKLSTFWSQIFLKKGQNSKSRGYMEKVEECYYPLFLI